MERNLSFEWNQGGVFLDKYPLLWRNKSMLAITLATPRRGGMEIFDKIISREEYVLSWQYKRKTVMTRGDMYICHK